MLPTLMKWVAPALVNSSTAMEADGHPTPVDMALITMPRYDPVMVRNSRL